MQHGHVPGDDRSLVRVKGKAFMKKITLKIVDMHCVSCSLTIDGDLEDADGVAKAHTNYAKALTEVEFDPEKISEKDIIRIIKGAGYTAKNSQS